MFNKKVISFTLQDLPKKKVTAEILFQKLLALKDSLATDEMEAFIKMAKDFGFPIVASRFPAVVKDGRFENLLWSLVEQERDLLRRGYDAALFAAQVVSPGGKKVSPPAERALTREEKLAILERAQLQNRISYGDVCGGGHHSWPEYIKRVGFFTGKIVRDGEIWTPDGLFRKEMFSEEDYSILLDLNLFDDKGSVNMTKLGEYARNFEDFKLDVRLGILSRSGAGAAYAKAMETRMQGLNGALMKIVLCRFLDKPLWLNHCDMTSAYNAFSNTFLTNSVYRDKFDQESVRNMVYPFYLAYESYYARPNPIDFECVYKSNQLRKFFESLRHMSGRSFTRINTFDAKVFSERERLCLNLADRIDSNRENNSINIYSFTGRYEDFEKSILFVSGSLNGANPPDFVRLLYNKVMKIMACEVLGIPLYLSYEDMQYRREEIDVYKKEFGEDYFQKFVSSVTSDMWDVVVC
ncbi:hypothetical protein A2526_04860 [candidate division WOR-1 bacterium RIFOXYD2_FULL_36_8]|uniref:Uncharacterized protein n=1 Tax=candidate division WOR-1 bacterium RIFOXYB2_FULL_36_35 TaxID=1802578 RepID=A0A1F4S3T2_UNCSA|nr:MAG: hypothetical protein A2230_09490 [candidate division WOR-1 bacterium RIFOXYA2_FULL_36_21]OGC15088.1 MAG: hypothetical protein A2290_09310 [candidate division WOR-1 bacterium RIFOXYB2_FULL_36_35]OGC16469.1 MAG: hypothetical protein A2282_03415 [candidate division WOR-1 bacterium RIFOXYA12_FULL_36_13]OGC41405.1 MAG: hypothetical protein A2526_04860 [candidate division WOR-1 bacterium RIFOXYD2_FULL_36_8]